MVSTALNNTEKTANDKQVAVVTYFEVAAYLKDAGCEVSSKGPKAGAVMVSNTVK